MLGNQCSKKCLHSAPADDSASLMFPDTSFFRNAVRETNIERMPLNGMVTCANLQKTLLHSLLGLHGCSSSMWFGKRYTVQHPDAYVLFAAQKCFQSFHSLSDALIIPGDLCRSPISFSTGSCDSPVPWHFAHQPSYAINTHFPFSMLKAVHIQPHGYKRNTSSILQQIKLRNKRLRDDHF